MVWKNPIITTKLQPPPLRAPLVPRLRLCAMLQHAFHYRLTLLSAPAGSGKTTLLSHWLTEQHTTISWLSLDPADNDPIRFWHYLTAALERHAPMHDLRALLSAPQPPTRDALLATCITALTSVSNEFLCILDDVHLLETPSLYEDIASLLSHLPAHVHFILSTRTIPPLPLSRFRARNALLELQGAELSFTETETALFLTESMQLQLTPEEIHALALQSEGWITGLQLAALSLQRGSPPTHVLEPFRSGQRYVLDYCIEEVLSQQPAEIQSFLLQTAILERFSAALCTAVTEREHSQHLLEQLERAHLFLLPLDEQRGWYRYHHLFAEALRTHLLQTHEQLVPALHQRASQWFARHHLFVEAVTHALQSNQLTYTAALMEEAVVELWFQGERQTLRRWLEALPAAVLEQHPRLCLYQALLFIYTHRSFVEAERLLQLAEDQLAVAPAPQELRGELEIGRSLIANLRGDHRGAIQRCQHALSSLPPHSRWHGQRFHTLGLCHHFSGNDAAALGFLQDGIAHCMASGDRWHLYNCTFLLAAIQHRHGQLQTAMKTARLALDTLSHTPTTAQLAIIFSVIYYEWNALDSALEHAQQCVDIGRRSENAQLIWLGNLHCARTLYARGEKSEALALFRTLNQDGKKLNRERAMMSSVAFQAPFWLAEGRIDVVLALVQEHFFPIVEPHDPLSLSEDEVRARLYLAQQDYEATLELLKHMHEKAQGYGWHLLVVQALLLQAITLYAQGSLQPALTLAREALVQTEQQGYVRSILDHGSLITPLLHLLLISTNASTSPRRPSPNTLHSLLAALEKGPAALPRRVTSQEPTQRQLPTTPSAALLSPVEPLALSQRERDVLLLLINGCSDREIAERLVIGQSTVASHMKRIYRKLDVHSRTQAVARARMLKLF